MRRKLFTFAACDSAVLCIALSVLCVRSYWVSDSWERDVHGGGVGRVGFGSTRGRVWWFRIRAPAGAGVTFDRTAGYHAVTLGPAATMTERPSNWSFAGFRWANYQFTIARSAPTILMQDFTVPDWALVLPTGAPPALWLLARRRRRRRSSSGYCLTCGYDLRATPDRCPECGVVPAKEEAAA
jgi:hypothetical protein